MRAPSLTVRLSLLFALSTTALLVGLGWTLERAVAAHFRALDREDLSGKLALVQRLLGTTETRSALKKRLEDIVIGHPDMVLWVRTAEGELIFERRAGLLPSNTFEPGEAAPPSRAAGDPPRWLQWRRGPYGFRGVLVELPLGPRGGESAWVAMGIDIGHHQRFMASLRHVLGLSVALTAVAAAGLGWGAVRMGLRPLRRVTSHVATLDASRLDARLPEAGVPVEIKVLVDDFNNMLARLEESFRRLSDFSADVAHELRTPLSNLTLQTQVALGVVREPEQYREILYSSLEEYERLARMINDMLFLAQADHGLLRPGTTVVDLADEARALFEYFEAWAEERGVGLELAGEAQTCGDPSMLRRALSNLLTNAIGHTEAGRSVRIELGHERDAVCVRVENPGPDIPPEQLSRLFDRFYRADPARTRHSEGGGLGLAIVRSIAQAHGGTARASSQGGLTRFELRLGRADRETSAGT
ncbi:heavy metal sensor histidine kinase [Marichromatium sp. AB32]|uniref:heavy metal sensor histidine kinase n=1 Tax=Marichromatium sp. AB32 TaxID=2483363 RepID=UPI0011CE251F|nr:heavy metal sensor histidine kinase [Marichromatium sp. AB32]